LTEIQNEPPAADPQTFGGVIPNLEIEEPPPEETLSLDTPDLTQEQQKQDFLTLTDPNTRVGISGEAGELRAAKFHFGLGKDSPGLETITAMVANGEEDSLRKQMAALEDSRETLLKEEAILEKAALGPPKTPEDITMMGDLGRFVPGNSPDTILEKTYANELVKILGTLGRGPDSVIGKGYNTRFAWTADNANVAARAMQKQAVIASVTEEIKNIAKNQGWFGFGVDVLKTFVPGYSEVKLESNLAQQSPVSRSYLRGSIKEEAIGYYLSLPADQMYRELMADIGGLARDNPHLAKEFVEALNAYTTSDKFIDSAFSVFDAVTLVPTGLFFKGGKAVKGAAQAAKPIRATDLPAYAFKTADEAAAAVREASQGVSSKTTVTVNGQSSTAASGKTTFVTSEDVRTQIEADAIQQAFKDAVRANGQHDGDVGSMLTAIGDMERAKRVNTQQRMKEIVSGEELDLTSAAATKAVPSYFNPVTSATGSKASMSATATDEMVRTLRANKAILDEAVANTGKVARLPEEALEVAFRETEAKILARSTHLNDTVIDVTRVRPDDTETNVAEVMVHFGKPGKGYFDSQQEAFRVAEKEYKLVSGSYRPMQHSLGWTLGVKAYVDETTPGVRSAMITTLNTTPKNNILSTYLSSTGIRSANDRLSDFNNAQRLAAVHGRSALEFALRNMTDNLYLGKTETEALRKVMRWDNAEEIIGDSGELVRGRTRKTQDELDEVFMDKVGRMPTQKESMAYWTFKDLQETDLHLRRIGVFRDRARKGIENYNLIIRAPGEDGAVQTNKYPTFGARQVEDLPYGNPQDAVVLVFREGQKEPERVMKSVLAGDSVRKADFDKLRAEGYRLLEMEDPIGKSSGKFLKEQLGVQGKVNFILTKEFTSRPLQIHEQIVAREGWHSVYPQGFYTKQPQITRQGDDPSTARHEYEGDMTLMGHDTEAEARLISQALETARQMMLRDDPKLDEFLKKNTPFTESRFRSLFELVEKGEDKPRFDKNLPFMTSAAGRNTADDHKNYFESNYQNFSDEIRSSYNLMGDVDKKFMGERDPYLWVSKEVGTELDPVYRLDKAEEVDPFETMSATMANIMRNRFFTDYKISSMESWAEEFWHTMKVSRDELRSNLTWYLHNPQWDESLTATEDLMRAKAARGAIIQLIGSPSDFDKFLDRTASKILDATYNKLGQAKAAEVVHLRDAVASADPVRAMRGFAFHTSQGLFALPQLWQNAAMVGNAIAISPKYGLTGALSAAGPMQMAFRNPAMVEPMAKFMSRFGMSAADFKESLSEFKKSGRFFVEGEHVLRDDMGDPKFLDSGVGGKVLDYGLVFMKEGERIARIAAWNTSFLEWRAANPRATITDTVRAQILLRSDKMTGNMTRASNAAWQQGLGAIPGQFLTFHARLAELTVGKRLTWQEKARVMIWNSAMYGIPIGVLGSTGLGALSGGMYSAYEGVREHMLKRGITVGNEHTDTFFHGGLVNLVSKIAGAPMDLAPRFGPGGSTLIKDVLDGKFIEVMLGPSGSMAGQTLASLDPVLKYVAAPFFEEEGKFLLQPEDVANVAKNLRSVNTAFQVYYGLALGQSFTKRGNWTDNVNATQTVLAALSGAVTLPTSYARHMQALDIDRQAMLKDLQKQIEPSARGFVAAIKKGDEALADVYQKRMNVWVAAGKLKPNERVQLFNAVLKDQMSEVERASFNFIKNAPSDQVKHRLESEMNRRDKLENAK
jgi:hypothetical protein